MPFAVAGAVAGVAGAAISASASSSAAGATKKAAADANATQQSEFATAQQDLAPYNNAGQSTIAQQQNLLGLNGQPAADAAMQTFQASPGYQYQVQQGLSAIDNGAASLGTLRSGNTVRAEEGLGANLANQDFTNYYNRLAGISGIGENAAAQTGNDAITTGQGIAQTDASAGNQLAGIDINSGKSLATGLNNGVNQLAYVGQQNGWFGGSSSLGSIGLGSLGGSAGNYASGVVTL